MIGGNDNLGRGNPRPLHPERLARPAHHLDAARQIAATPEQRVHLGAPPDAPRGIPSVLQPVGIPKRRTALASRPLAQLNLTF